MATYSVVAPDGAMYGPVDETGIAQWIREGRVLRETVLHCHETNTRTAAWTVPALQQPLGLPSHAIPELDQMAKPGVPSKISQPPFAPPVINTFQKPNQSAGIPLTGILSVIGLIPAWFAFALGALIITHIRPNINYFVGPTDQQKNALGFGGLCAIISVPIAIATIILGIFATVQNGRSKITGIIGLIGSAVLLLAALTFFCLF